jgi:hypothetical protein
VKAIVQHPQIVEEACERFEHLFQNNPQLNHFANMLTGLTIVERKTINAISNECVDSPDQSCLNRFMNHAKWDHEQLNTERIAMMQEDEDTQFHRRGVVGIDDVLVDKYGKFIKNVGYFYDHSQQRSKLAMDMVIANYIHPNSGKHYPMYLRFFRKQKQCEESGDSFYSHTELCKQLIDAAIEVGAPPTFAFDSYYTSSEVQNYIHAKNLDGQGKIKIGKNEPMHVYVGDVKMNRLVQFQSEIMSVTEMASRIEKDDRKRIVHSDGTTQWYFTKSLRMPGSTPESRVDHKVRVVIFWERRNSATPRKVLVTNQTGWDVHRVVRTYRARWSCTETFHRDGKQELGLGKCQLRSEVSQQRYLYLLFLAYSLLVRSTRRSRSRAMLWSPVRTIGECCNEVAKESMRLTISWVANQVQNGADILHSLRRVNLLPEV